MVLCAGICFVWAWYGAGLLVEQFGDPMAYDELRAQFDIRSWVGTLPFPVGFALIGLEFLRFAFTREPMHVGLAGVASERAELEAQTREIQRQEAPRT